MAVEPPALCWGYLRVSTSKQETDNQRIQMEGFCNSRNLWIPEDRWYIDDETHGWVPAIQRVQFKKLHDDLVDLSSRGVELPKNVLMYEVSRIGRTFWESLEAIKFLESLSPIMSTSPKESFIQIQDKSMRNFMLAILAFFAERELEVLKQRTKEGVTRAHGEGKHSGNVFLGYYQWSHLDHCKQQDHGFGSTEKNERLCPLRGKLFSDELGRRAIGLYQANPKVTAKLLSVSLAAALPGETARQKYKAAWNLLNNVKELGLLVEPTTSASRSP